MGVVSHVWPLLTQPQDDPRIDWENPLTRGLFLALSPTHGIDVVTGRPLTLVSGPTIVATSAGRAGRTNGSASYFRFDFPSTGFPAFTIATITAPTSTPTLDSRAFALGSSTDNDPMAMINVGSAGATKLRTFWRDDFGNYPASIPESTADAFTVGRMRVLALSVESTTTTNVGVSKLYIDGAADATSSVFTGAGLTVDRAAIGALLRSTATSFYPGDTPLGVFWNRELTPAEHAEFAANPWQIFEPVRIWVPVSAGGGVTHEATGALSAQSATLAGSAADVRTFTSAGAMTAQAATLAGIAAHLTLHTSIGAISAQAATLSGAANHVTIHASSGALTAQAATLSGSANLAVGGAFTAVGALTSQSATVAGTAAHYTLHAATGDLEAQAATLAGVATHLTLHTSTGVLVADPASVSGVAVHSGDGAEVVQPRTGAGKSRRQSQRVVVEIDGEDFIAESPEEAQAILDQAKEAAEEKAKVAVERATRARNRPTRKVMADARKALELPTISAPDLGGYAEEISRQIEDIYQSAIQTIEVAALLRKRELEEEDDEDILLLIA